MANFGKTKTIIANAKKRYPSEREALSDAGYVNKGVFTYKKVGGNELCTRRIYADPDGNLVAYLGSNQRGYTITEIQVKEFTGNPDLVK